MMTWIDASVWFVDHAERHTHTSFELSNLSQSKRQIPICLQNHHVFGSSSCYINYYFRRNCFLSVALPTKIVKTFRHSSVAVHNWIPWFELFSMYGFDKSHTKQWTCWHFKINRFGKSILFIPIIFPLWIAFTCVVRIHMWIYQRQPKQTSSSIDHWALNEINDEWVFMYKKGQQQSSDGRMNKRN